MGWDGLGWLGWILDDGSSSSLDSILPPRHWSIPGQCHNVSRQVSALSGPTIGIPGGRQCMRRRDPGQRATGRKKMEWRPNPVERMMGWRKKKKEAPAVVQAPTRSFVCSRCGGKIHWGGAWISVPVLASPSVGHPPVENPVLASHCRELETFRWHSFGLPLPLEPLSCTPWLYFLPRSSSILHDLPRPSLTAAHQRPPKNGSHPRSRPPWDRL